MRATGRFKEDVGGAAAVEFAVLAPVLLLLFLGMVELSQAHNRRKILETSVATIADLVARQRAFDAGDAAGLMSGFRQLLEPLGPFDPSLAEYYVASVSRVRDSSDGGDSRVQVDWSIDQNLQEAFPAGAPYTDLDSEINLTANDSPLEVGASVIVAKIRYRGEGLFFHPRFAGMGTPVGQVETRIERYAIRWPRRTGSVAFTP